MPEQYDYAAELQAIARRLVALAMRRAREQDTSVYSNMEVLYDRLWEDMQDEAWKHMMPNNSQN